jgi:hypothetical protein
VDAGFAAAPSLELVEAAGVVEVDGAAAVEDAALFSASIPFFRPSDG